VVFLIRLGKISVFKEQQIKLLAAAGLVHNAIYRTIPALVISEQHVLAKQDRIFCCQPQGVVDVPPLMVNDLGQSR